MKVKSSLKGSEVSVDIYDLLKKPVDDSKVREVGELNLKIGGYDSEIEMELKEYENTLESIMKIHDTTINLLTDKIIPLIQPSQPTNPTE